MARTELADNLPCSPVRLVQLMGPSRRRIKNAIARAELFCAGERAAEWHWVFGPRAIWGTPQANHPEKQKSWHASTLVAADGSTRFWSSWGCVGTEVASLGWIPAMGMV
jgi:hypothetical protein